MKYLQLAEAVVSAGGKLCPAGEVIEAGTDGWPAHRCDRMVMRGQAVEVRDNPKPKPVEDPKPAKPKAKASE